MKPTSDVDICNLALDHLKQSPINSIITPISTTEYIFKRWYDTVRMAALRAHPWKFATKRITLTPTGTVPPFGFAYAYDLPNDYIRMVSIGDDYLGDLRLTHVIENGQILTPSGNNAQTDTGDASTLYVRYVYDCVDVNKFDQLFVGYLALKLALKVAAKFTISNAAKQDLKDDFRDVEIEAKAVNGQDAPIKRIQQSKLLTKRRGLPGGIYATKYTIFDS